MRKRALIVVRLSNLTDESTSPERQREMCEKVCADRDWEVVGVAEDLDISATTSSPFDRPSLKKWLDRPFDYDVVVFWRVDRLVRRVTHLSRMIEWSEEHNVTLVSATEAHFDLSTSMGQAIAYMVGIFAQMESDAIRERTEQAHAHNRMQGKYTGGIPPFGYLPAQREDGTWGFEPDPEQVNLILSIVNRVLEGERPNTIVKDLNSRGVPTPQDLYRKWRGEAMKGQKWRHANIARHLRSPKILGQTYYREPVGKDRNGKKIYGDPKILRNPDGTPVQRSEPLIDRDTYDRLCKALDDMNGKKSPYTKSQALLLRVIKCGVCGSAMYLNHGRNYKYYRCVSASYQTACGNTGVPQHVAEELVEEALLTEFGDDERHKREYDPGEDTAQELAEVVSELTDVAGLIGTGPYKSGPPRKALEDRAESLEARRQELEATEARPAGYHYKPTGETFRAHWERLDSQGRNLFLRDNGVELIWDKGEFHNVWGELDKLKQAIAGKV